MFNIGNGYINTPTNKNHQKRSVLCQLKLVTTLDNLGQFGPIWARFLTKFKKSVINLILRFFEILFLKNTEKKS